MIRDPESFNILLDTVSRFVRERLIPRESEVAATDEMPSDILSDMRGMGLFGLTIPEEYGGLGLTMEEEVQVAMVLCHASPAFRSIVGTNNGIGSLGIVIDGSEAQKQRYLPRLARGEEIPCFALTGPEAGSDAAATQSEG
ncbi:MAG TPA: acyl-CoA dehydrogenase family protein, partial [Burkholderiales bacterium]